MRAKFPEDSRDRTTRPPVSRVWSTPSRCSVVLRNLLDSGSAKGVGPHGIQNGVLQLTRQDIIGSFRVIGGRILPDSYERNPKHRILSRFGILRPHA